MRFYVCAFFTLLFTLPMMGEVLEEGLPIDTTFHLNDVVVTATRTPKLLKDVPVQTRLITEQDI